MRKSARIAVLAVLLILTLCVGIGMLWYFGTDRKPPEMKTVGTYEAEYNETVTMYDLVRSVNDRSKFTLSMTGGGEQSEDGKSMTFGRTGVYPVTLTAQDVYGNSVTETVQVTIVDTQPPELEAERFEIYLGEEPDYLAHVTALDGHDGDLTSYVQVSSGEADLQNAGSYHITYSITDHAGNTAKTESILEILPRPADFISLDNGSIALAGNEYCQLHATVEPYEWKGELKWTSSNENVATVCDGLVVWKGVGSCVITVQADEVSAECKVSCVETQASAVWLNVHTMELDEGKSQTLTTKTLPSNYTGGVKWSTSNAKVATVKDGVVKWTGGGTCTITALAGGVSDSCTVTCKSKPIENIITDIIGDLIKPGKPNNQQNGHGSQNQKPAQNTPPAQAPAAEQPQQPALNFETPIPSINPFSSFWSY